MNLSCIFSYKSNIKTIVIVAMFLFYFAEFANSRENPFNLSLEDLMNIEIEVVSKREENIYKAPGIVNVITSDDIRKFGANKLNDILRRLPGVETPSLYIFRDNMISIRAQHDTAVDNRTLLLLNGRPMRESASGGFNAPVYLGLPIGVIDHIEVIRGPGSVLYGSNAFSGVINIVTKKPESFDATASIKYGSFGTNITEATLGGKNNDFVYYGGLKAYNMTGWNYELFDLNNTFGSTDYKQDAYGGTLNVKYKDISLEYLSAKTHGRSLNPVPNLPFENTTIKRNFLDLGYDFFITDKWKADAHITHNGFSSDIVNINKSNDILGEISLNGAITDKINVLLGTVYDRHKWNRDTPHLEGHTTWKSYYVQLDYQALERLKLIAGIQHNDPENLKPDESPRFAAIVNFDDNWGAKLLYGKAFRSAYATERFENFPGVLNGNPDLKPEKIQTVDFQLFYHSPIIFGAVTLYKSREKDTIELDFSGPLVTYVNSGITRYQGIEFEGKLNISKELNLQGSVTYQSNESFSGEKNIKKTPNLMIKTGLTYDRGNGITTSLFNSYFSDYASVDTATIINRKSRAYNHLNVNIIFDVAKIFGIAGAHGLYFSLYGDNLLEYHPMYAPDAAREEFNTMPTRPGRAVYAMVTARY